MIQSINIHLDDDDQILCSHCIREDRPQGYPLLVIESAENMVDRIVIYPTLDRLRRLHAAIGAYLAAHDAPGRAPIPADAATDCDDEWESYSVDGAEGTVVS